MSGAARPWWRPRQRHVPWAAPTGRAMSIPGCAHGAHRAARGAALAKSRSVVQASRSRRRADHGLTARADAPQRAGGSRQRRYPRRGRDARTLPGRHRVLAPRAHHRRRAASLRCPAAPAPAGEGQQARALSASAHHDRDADSAHAGHDRLRRPRHLRDRRVAARPHAGADSRGAGAAARGSSGAHRHSLPRRPSGLLGLSAHRRIGRVARAGRGRDRRRSRRDVTRGTGGTRSRPNAALEEGHSDARLQSRHASNSWSPLQ